MEEGSTEEFLFKDQDFSSELLRQLNALRQSRMLTDVTLCSEGFEIPCHRNVLASSSPYFKAMFCNDFRESRQAKVTLKGISAEILDQIILYIYTGEILISAENVLCLLETASMLQYAKLFEACSVYLQDKLSPDNCLSMIRLAKVLNCQSLNKKAKAMALKCFPEVASSEDLKDLCPLELIDYLGDDELCGEEEQVFEALMVWIRHDLQARQGYIQELFKKVRLQYVHPTFLFHFIANDSLVQSSPTCRSILESAWRHMFSLYNTNTPDIKPMMHVPRRYSNQEFLIIIGGRKDSQQTTRDVLLYDDKTNQWLSLAKLPMRLYKASAVSLHSNIYVLGGMPVSNKKSPEILNSVERYDSIYNTCEIMANMPVAVLHPAVAAKDQRVYLFGGEDIMQNPVRLIQVYHVSRNTWFRMETRVVKNVCAPAVMIGDQIIIVGGYTRRIIAYDTKGNKFVKCADMKDRRMHHGATVIKNKLYVTGGRCLTTNNVIKDLDSLDCYDPETDTWTAKGKLPHRLFDHGCLTLQCVPCSKLL
ncbi:kelch-like protein 38 isoform X2 [Athene noctua]|uniref:kelch-like protein 38 isoform X2 n=1 Tax=Athene noctua TaxID=126797 RepID=UPI003EB6DC40